MLKKNKISSREYFAYIKSKENFGNLTSKEFAIFLKKFCGTLVYRGKKKLFYKSFKLSFIKFKKKF